MRKGNQIAPPPAKRPPSEGGRWSPTAVAVAYALAGALWILLADNLAETLSGGGAAQARLHSALSWLAIGASAVALRAALRRALEPHRQAECALEATIESMADAVLVVDRRQQIVKANQAAADLLGVARREELMISIAEFGERFDLRYLTGERVPIDHYASARALDGRVTHRYEASMRRSGGDLVSVSVSAAPVRGGPGQPEQAVAVLRDVSELKRLERLRDEFLSTAAHELKTPVAVVKGYSQLLLRRAPGEGSEGARGLEVINRQCDRMTRLVEDLLEVSRVRLGELQLRRESFDAAELAADVVGRMQAMTVRHSIRLDATPGAVVYADPWRIDQVLTNLLDNAIKFSPEGGEIRASVRHRGNEVRLEVEDHGLGIPEECKRQIFQRFFQAHTGRLPSTAGVGVGLYLAREIVRRHRGRIEFQSREGAGSTFVVVLPSEVGAEALREIG